MSTVSTVQSMDAATQHRLIGCVTRMTGLVRHDQMDPTEALVKVASEQSLTPPQVRRVGEAYNVSRSIANQKMASGEGRCENFPLALPDQAMKAVFPEQYQTPGQVYLGRQMQKAAGLVVDVYDRVTDNLIEKVAIAERLGGAAGDEPAKTVSPYADDANVLHRRFTKQADAYQLAVRVASQEAAEARLAFEEHLTKAASAVRGVLLSVPFERVEQNLVSHYGQGPGVKLASLMYRLSGAEAMKQARATRFTRTLADYTLSPYNEIDRFVKAALDLQEKGDLLDDIEQKGGPPDPFAVRGAGPADENPLIKTALFDVTGRMIDRAVGQLDVSDQPRYQQELAKVLGQVQDPDTRDASRQVDIQAMLTDMLTRDEVLRDADPDAVVEHYNELVKMAPDLADQPLMMRSLLRRSVATGAVDPFEVGQVLSANSQFRNSQKVDTSEQQALAQDTRSLNPLLFEQKDSGKSGRLGNLSKALGVVGSDQTPVSGKWKNTDPRLAVEQKKLGHQQSQLAYQKNLNTVEPGRQGFLKTLQTLPQAMQGKATPQPPPQYHDPKLALQAQQMQAAEQRAVADRKHQQDLEAAKIKAQQDLQSGQQGFTMTENQADRGLQAQLSNADRSSRVEAGNLDRRQGMAQWSWNAGQENPPQQLTNDPVSGAPMYQPINAEAEVMDPAKYTVKTSSANPLIPGAVNPLE